MGIGLSATLVMTGSMPGSSRKSTKMSFIRVNHNSSCAKRASSLASGEQYAIERTTPSKNWLSNAPCFADCLKKMLFICGIIIQYFSRPTFKKLHLGGCRKQRVLSVLRQTIQQQDRKWPKNIQYFPTSTYTWIGLSATFVMTGSMPGSR